MQNPLLYILRLGILVLLIEVAAIAGLTDIGHHPVVIQQKLRRVLEYDLRAVVVKPEYCALVCAVIPDNVAFHFVHRVLPEFQALYLNPILV